MTDEASYTPEQPLHASISRPSGRRYYWRVKVCAPGFACSPYTDPWWINAGRTNQDFNGDGYADFLIGAPGADRRRAG